METIVGRLRDAGVVKGDIVVCDATFIKAYSKRDPNDGSRGCSDPDARLEGLGRVIGSATSST